MKIEADTTHRQCTAKNRDGEPCGRAPIVGASVCWTHGGATRQVQAKAAERRAELRIMRDVASRTIEPITDPISWYQMTAGEVALFLELCREQLRDLSSLTRFDAKDVEDVRAVVALYERGLDRASRVGEAMLRLGIEAKAASRTAGDAAWAVDLVRQAVSLARADAAMSADAILLSLIGGAR